MHKISFLFFFKQKTAYEMRISDWSSDVCSSDLRPREARLPGRRRRTVVDRQRLPDADHEDQAQCHRAALSAACGSVACRAKQAGLGLICRRAMAGPGCADHRCALYFAQATRAIIASRVSADAR